MESSEEPLVDRVRAWLQMRGYPLEMLVAAAFRREGFDVAQGEYFDDPQTQEPREMDIFAYKEVYDKAIVLRVSYVIECKSSRRAPWVLFTGSRGAIDPSARMIGTASSKNGSSLLVAARRNAAVRDLPLFTRPESPAYGLTLSLRDKSENVDTTYEAAMKVAKAASARIRRTEREEDMYGPTADIIFPVIVTGAPLFEAFLDLTDQLTLLPVQRSTLVWRNPGVGRRTTVIDVINADYLEQFVKEASTATTTLISSVDAELAAVAARNETRNA